MLGLLTFTHLVSTAGYSAIFVLCLLQSCCVPTSSELTLGFAGVLAAQGRLSLAAVIVVGVLGEVVGAYVAWVVGRYAGRGVVDRFGRYILLGHRDLDRAEAWYDRHQRFGVFGSRLLPVIRNFVALPAGIAEVPLGRFGVLTAAGSLLWDGAWAGIGYGVGAHWHAIAKGVGDIGYVLAVLALVAIACALYHRYRSYKAASSGIQAARTADAGLTAGGSGTGPDGRFLRSAIEADARGLRIRRARHLNDVRAISPTPVDPDRSTRRFYRASTGAVPGADRWVAGSSVRPPTHARRPPAAAASDADRWVTGSSGRPPTHNRHSEFPRSPVTAWEAAVVRGQKEPEPRAQLLDEGEGGVEANGRLTAMTGALLLVLLAVEGFTILHVGALLTMHVVIGMVLVPVIVLKIGSTTWRFARYYLGSPQYRRKGPPPATLRLLGPFVVVSSVAVVGSGIALLLAPASLRNELLLIHKVTFIVWFAAMVVHVLGHLLDVAHLAPRDFYRRTRRQVRGAGARQWAIVSAVCVGIVLALAVAPKVGPWLAGRRPGPTPTPVHVHVHGKTAGDRAYHP